MTKRDVKIGGVDATQLHFALLHRTSPRKKGILQPSQRTTTFVCTSTDEPCFRKNGKRNPRPIRLDFCNSCVIVWPEIARQCPTITLKNGNLAR